MKHCCYPEIAKTTFDQNPYTESQNNLHCVVSFHKSTRVEESPSKTFPYERKWNTRYI